MTRGGGGDATSATCSFCTASTGTPARSMPQQPHAGGGQPMISSGFSHCRSVEDCAPGCLPGLRPVFFRRERSRGLRYGPSDDGGLEDVEDSLPRRLRSSSTCAASTASCASRTASSAAASSSRAARASRSRALTASSSATRARSCSTSPQAGGCGVPDTAGQHHSRLTVINSTRRARSPTSHHGSPARTRGTAGHWGPADLPAESAAADVVAMPLT